MTGGKDWQRLRQTAAALRERMFAAGTALDRPAGDRAGRLVHYLSMEFLLGRSLRNAALNLGLDAELSAELAELETLEPDAALGSGGLGRLAACFMDSCATLDIPAIGYGIRYRYGLFRQLIEDGRQVEAPDDWLAGGALWERQAPADTRRVRFAGDLAGDGEAGETVAAIPCDLPVPGYRNGRVNVLRLWRAEAASGGDPAAAERLCAALYPDDSTAEGRELRLRQQYFMASATLQDILARWLDRGGAAARFAEGNVLQLNDTHPVIAIPELMRLLLDDHGLGWEEAWQVTRASMAFTNHTLLPEALETWPLALVERLLPRPAEIIREIDRRWLAELDRAGIGDERRERMAVIARAGEPEPLVRMANLGLVGSFSVNGVAALHTRLLETGLFRDFFEHRPAQFSNKTNGVSPRRWLAFCNPGLSALISDAIGDGWQTDLARLQALAPLAEDKEFVRRFMAVKQANKRRLAALVQQEAGLAFDPQMLFAVQVKRIHEYKRQLLNLLHLAHLYNRIREGRTSGMAPRCALLGGKAAPGYAFAKQVIRLAGDMARTVNADPAMAPWLRVAFLPNFRVSSMEVIVPGADLSEQISTAGKEASGTGNMKFMMNGALTIGTLDGANIEIREAVGAGNFFLFGKRAEEVAALREGWSPEQCIAESEGLAQALSLIESGHFNPDARDSARELVAALRSPDEPWATLADFAPYAAAQREAGAAYADADNWGQMALRNTAASGRFSSDRTVAEYQDHIWRRQTK